MYALNNLVIEIIEKNSKDIECYKNEHWTAHINNLYYIKNTVK